MPTKTKTPRTIYVVLAPYTGTKPATWRIVDSHDEGMRQVEEWILQGYRNTKLWKVELWKVVPQ